MNTDKLLEKYQEELAETEKNLERIKYVLNELETEKEKMKYAHDVSLEKEENKAMDYQNRLQVQKDNLESTIRAYNMVKNYQKTIEELEKYQIHSTEEQKEVETDLKRLQELLNQNLGALPKELQETFLKTDFESENKDNSPVFEEEKTTKIEDYQNEILKNQKELKHLEEEFEELERAKNTLSNDEYIKKLTSLKKYIRKEKVKLLRNRQIINCYEIIVNDKERLSEIENIIARDEQDSKEIEKDKIFLQNEIDRNTKFIPKSLMRSMEVMKTASASTVSNEETIDKVVGNIDEHPKESDEDYYFDKEEQLSDEEVVYNLKVEGDSDRKITDEYLLKYKNLSLDELKDRRAALIQMENSLSNSEERQKNLAELNAIDKIISVKFPKNSESSTIDDAKDVSKQYESQKESQTTMANLSLEELQDKYVEISNQMKNANTDNDLQELIQQRELIENQIKHKGGAIPLEQNSNSVDMSSKSNDNETSSYNLNLDHFDKRFKDILSRAHGLEYSPIANRNDNTTTSELAKESDQRTTIVSPTESVDNEETIANELPENQEIEENVLTSNNEENTNKKKKIKSVRKSIINMAKKIKMHIATLGVSLVLLTAGLVAIKEIKKIPSSAKVEAETLQTKSNDKGISTAETPKDTISILGETNSTENQTEKETISDIDNSIDTMLSNKTQILEKQGDGNLSNSRDYQTDDENKDYQTIETENKADISLVEDNQSQTIQVDFNDDNQMKLDNTTAEREIQTNQNYDSHIKIGDEVTISGSGSIFETASKAYMYEEAQIPYYGFEAKRVVIGVAIETNEQGMKVVYAYDPEANQKINSFLEQGGNIVCILTANKEKHLAKYDGSRALTPDEIRASVEGWYNATDVNKNQVKGKSR